METQIEFGYFLSTNSSFIRKSLEFSSSLKCLQMSEKIVMSKFDHVANFMAETFHIIDIFRSFEATLFIYHEEVFRSKTS